MGPTLQPSCRNNGNGKAILVVDDEEFIRAFVRERLEIAGYSIGEARNGKDALAMLSTGRYSVLLTDIRMPEMDGITLLKESTTRFPDTAGIVMSAHAELDTAVAALKIGACDYITKPFNFDVLLITIENAIRKKAIERQLQDYKMNLERKVKEQTDLINSMYVRSIDALIKALEAKDFYTRGHSQRVTMYSVAIGKSMRLPQERIEFLHQAAVLHDLGKIGIREDILNKRGKLTAEEFKEITLHPEVAIGILEPIPFFRPILPAILHHHERFDGRGYPRGLAGQDTPLESRIMAIADTFDAMTSTRAYRNALSLEAANAEILRCSGAQFDPEIVPFFMDVQGKIEILGNIEDLIMPDARVDTIFARSC
ncbi:MAG TPA: HD domain-containing phosphohydrolase [Candidatus Limnocylindrales bacterium]|nr:HD domain-containing phosphohydrolase [Candidatus Limnocylindrales bacterium]